MAVTLEFEKPIAELESKLSELRHLSSNGEVNITAEVNRLQEKVDTLLKKTYGSLSPGRRCWSRVTPKDHTQVIILRI